MVATEDRRHPLGGPGNSCPLRACCQLRLRQAYIPLGLAGAVCSGRPGLPVPVSGRSGGLTFQMVGAGWGGRGHPEQPLLLLVMRQLRAAS